MDYPSLRRIAYGFIITVVIAMAIVFTGSMYLHAEREAARADDATHDLATAETKLALTRSVLTKTQDQLVTVENDLARTSQELSRTTGQRGTLQTQCRYLVAVNDHLMGATAAYDRATGFLLDGRRPRAGMAVAWAGRHLDAINAVVRRSGHRNISGLVNACAPPVR